VLRGERLTLEDAMRNRRFKQPTLWLILIAFVVSCTPVTTVTESASATRVPLPTASPIPTASPTVAGLLKVTSGPQAEEAPAVETRTAATPLPAIATETVLSPTATSGPAVAVAPAALQVYWPTEGWRTSKPEEQDVDSQRLQRMFTAIDERRLNVHSVLVVRNGFIIAETYYPPYDREAKHRVFSVTKSFISALIGIALERGFIDGLDDRVVDFFPERTFAHLDDGKATMTLAHLLTMTSGLDWQEGLATYQELADTRDWVQYVLDKPMAVQPGRQFRYCSGCSHVMSAILQKRTGVGTLEFAQTHLFQPLGISNLRWELDGSGIPNGGWGLHLTPRDMAKLGLLYLNGGYWDGQQIVPAEWVKDSVSDGVDANGGWHYGYQWWLGPGEGHFAAVGLGAQVIYVMPELDMVVVFTAALDSSDALYELIEDYVVPAADAQH
jgi:CubicO group peptidase (beta-lactamase class C family)